MLIKIYCLKKISKILLEELIGVATSEKDGLMPSIQRMTTSYQKDQQKYCKIAEFRNRLTGISMLISVLEGLLGINDTWYKRRFGEITDFNEANNTGYMFVDKTQSLDNKPNTSSNYGFLETIAINEVTIKQTFVDFQSRFFIRICNNGTWTDWKQIQTT